MTTKKIVCKVVPDLEASLVPISKLKPHPENPRVGNVKAIASSLKSNGQYRAIVVQKSTNFILAGNHTYKAAQSLKWTHIAVDWVDCDDQQAKRIVLADNRTGDRGHSDERKLLSFLKELPDLEGTGYDDDFLRRLGSSIDSGEMFSQKPKEIGGHKMTYKSDVLAVFAIGTVHYQTPVDTFCEWLKDNQESDNVCKNLQWPTLPIDLIPKAREIAAAAKKTTNQAVTIQGEEMDIASLRRLPGSPRVADLDAVKDSLRVNGQYRRVVVNTRDNTVVINWAVVCAAQSLGWKTIKAVKIDVDEATAKKIHASDNRCSELAYYDENVLSDMLTSFQGEFDGTGYSGADVEFLLEGIGKVEAAKALSPRVWLRVKCSQTETDWQFAAERVEYEKWFEQVLREGRYSDSGTRRVLASRLGIGPESLSAKNLRDE